MTNAAHTNLNYYFQVMLNHIQYNCKLTYIIVIENKFKKQCIYDLDIKG